MGSDELAPSAGQPTGVVVVPCADLDRAIAHYVGRGFLLDAIGPADEPTWGELSMPGIRLRVDASSGADGPLELRVESGYEPSGVRVPPVVASLVVEHESCGRWRVGRAGMRYRDLIPDRYGGAVVASHIHVPDGGPVPDYVHYHDVVFQMISCHRGWVRVVYEDQGPPFVLEPGDAVLQPPGIRHQVLESSDELYVVEITCPAVHRTNIDHALSLPTPAVRPERRIGRQRFVRHVAATAGWAPVGRSAVEAVDLGLAAATAGLAEVRRLRPSGPSGPAAVDLGHDADVRVVFVLTGRAELSDRDGPVEALTEGSSVALPAGRAHSLRLAPGSEVLDAVLHLT